MSKTNYPIKRYFGVEITRCHPKLEVINTFVKLSDNQSKDLSIMISAMNSKRDDKLLHEIYNDPGCAEFPTQVLDSYETLNLCWNHVESLVSKHGLFPNSEKAWGGGGHVNVSLARMGNPSLDNAQVQRYYYRMVRLICENPFLIWAYGDPGDNHGHCAFGLQRVPDENKAGYDRVEKRSIITTHGTKAEFEKLLRTKFFHDRESSQDLWFYSSCDYYVVAAETLLEGDPAIVYKVNDKDDFQLTVKGKDSVLKSDYIGDQRFELRFFGTATSAEEQEAHVEMAQALMDHAWRYKAQHDDPRARFMQMRGSLSYTVRQFKALVKELGLSWTRHKHFTQNIEERFRYGQDWLN